MKFVETLFQITIYYQLSVVHWVMSDKLYKHQCCLLSLSRSDVVWSNVVLLTPCPWETGLTSLLTMIDQLTCYWPYGAPWDHLPKIKIESCHSLPVDYGTRVLITKGSITHKLLSWDNIPDLYVVQCHLPTEINIIRSCCQLEYGDTVTNLCFTQLFIGHLKHD